MAMDIEKFVEAKGRDEKIKEVRKKIDELGIEYLYLLVANRIGVEANRCFHRRHHEQLQKVILKHVP